MKRVIKVTQVSEIVLRNGVKYPLSVNTRIELDKKNKANNKLHCVIYQQDLRYYGNVGDYCYYITHEELFELEEKRMIKIN